MKLNNIYIIITGLLLFSIVAVSDAQDLIKDTQRGINTSTLEEPNRVAKEIARVKANIDFKLVAPFQMSEKDMRMKHRDYVSEEIYLTLNTKELNKIFDEKRDHIIMDVPVSDAHNFQVELMKVNILTDDFKVTTSDGEVVHVGDFPGTFYRGIVKDNPNSIVSISVFEGQIKGLISDDNGNYVLGQIEDQSDVYVLYNDRDLKVSSNISCGVTEEMEAAVENIHEQTSAKSVNSSCIDVYIEADYHTYQSFGSSTANVINFATSLFNQVSTLYANENIGVQISQIFVWTSTDPYAVHDNTLDVLYEFRDYRTSFNGSLAHLISRRSLGGGIAWTNVLCSNTLAYAVSANLSSSVVPIPTYSWNVNVFAHEMGHNFGSPHTHACAWNGNSTQIDDCGNKYLDEDGDPDTSPNSCYNSNNQILPSSGTIMSYCHLNTSINFNLGFGQQPGDLIRSRFNAAACKTTCAGGCPANQTVTTTYNNGSNIDIEVSNTITANNIINSGANVDYDAGNLVRLTTGFHAKNGSTFHAFNDGCGGALIVSEEENAPNTDEYALKSNIETTDISDFTLRNYPNPFTGQTTIEYNLPNDNPVMLVITNLTGKRIAVLVNNEQQAKGIQTVTFNGSDYPAGTYYYTIQAGNYVETQKMILIK